MEMSKQNTSGINKIEAKRQEVIDYILTEINNGNPHVFNNPNHPSLFEQYNFKTDKTYSGMNRFILAVSASLEGYKDPRWLTYKQAKELGYSVKKGTHGTTLENLVAQEQQLIAEGKLPSIVNCPNGQIITNDMNQDNLISSTREQNTVKFDKNFAISIRHKEGLLCHNTNMIVLGGGTSFDYLLQDTPEKMLGPDDAYREFGGHFYALDHDPESPNLYKGDYAIQLMNDVVLEDMTVHLVNANRTITLADGTGFDSQNPSNVRSCLGCYDKLGINFHIIDKNGEFHTFESRIDLGDLDTISKTPMLDVLKSMEKWTSVKLEGLSDDVHAMVEELEDRLKRNELPSPSVQTNPKIYTEKLQALYNSHSNPEKYAEALKPVKEMLNVTQTKDLSQKPKVGLSISKPKGKSGLER
jgi:hypothetical protein